MKNIFLLLLINFIFTFFTNAQHSNNIKEVPNYILAKNSNFLVSIELTEVYKSKRAIKTTSSNSIPEALAKTISTTLTETLISEQKRKQPKKIQKELFDTICEMILPRLRALNMSPSSFQLKSNYEDSIEYKKKIDSNFSGTPYFKLIFNIPENHVKKMKKLYESKELSLEKIHLNSIIIHGNYSPDYINYSNTFSNISLDKALKMLSEEIDKKPKTYFIEKLSPEKYEKPKIKELNLSDISSLYENLETVVTIDPISLWSKEKKLPNIDSWPIEEELSTNEILLIVDNKRLYKKSIKHLQKYYPYNYKVILSSDSIDHKKYKYFFIIKKSERVTKNIRTETRNGFERDIVSYKTENFYYFFIRDAKSLIDHYRDRAEFNHSSRSLALKSILKKLQKHYNWEKNKK